MKKPLVVAAFLAIPLAGCATASTSGSGSGTRAQAMASGTHYCWKERLTMSGDGLVCNWEASRTDACTSSAITTTLSKGSVSAGPMDAGRCTNGQWLVQVTTK